MANEKLHAKWLGLAAELAHTASAGGEWDIEVVAKTAKLVNALIMGHFLPEEIIESRTYMDGEEV